MTTADDFDIIIQMTSELYLRFLAISLYIKTAERIKPLADLLLADTDEQRITLCSKVFYETAAAGKPSTGEWIASLVETDENPFSRAAACGERISDAVRKQAESELLTFKQLSLLSAESFADEATADILPRFVCGGFSHTYEKLNKFYRAASCGDLARGDAFIYDGEGFTAVKTTARLTDLVEYADEKAEIVKNTENFIKGLPAFHALLYGDRGTGKSTTVQALANEYKGKLKLIQPASGRLDLLPMLLSRLKGLKQKFIIFLDDLSFEENVGEAESFKTALEGSLDGLSSVLVYATSNRRHLFKETDRAQCKNLGDERQAELALFDRFGLVITYVAPDKDGYIDILRGILSSRGIKWREEYASVAELAAIKKGGRTPRAAKQIADLIESTYAEFASTGKRR